ncbi:MAG: outer membrane lipoprotein-sorting protein [Pseudomonadota bacterium]
MKTEKLSSIVVAFLGLCAYGSPVWSIEATDIVKSVLDKLSPGQWVGDNGFTNYRVDGTQHDYSLHIQAQNSKTVHVTFLSPATDAGRQILNRDGEIWSYLPDSRKIVRLADRESIGNGDFNNADVLRMNWLDLYTPKMAKESDTQYVIDLEGKPDQKPTYFLMRLWVLKKTLQPVQQFFYDDAGHHMKTLKYRDIKTFGGITRPATLVMENVITGQRTVLTVEAFKKVSDLPDTRFRSENLGK